MRFLLISILAVFAVGCATPYQSAGLTGGYSETQLAPDVFRVSFQGNGYTSGDRAKDFVLLRAAELCLQRGFTCFAIIDESNSTTTSSFSTPGQSQTTGYAYVCGNTTTYMMSTTYSPGQTFFFHKPNAGLLVQGFHTKPAGIFTFDAPFLQQSVRQRYGIN